MWLGLPGRKAPGKIILGGGVSGGRTCREQKPGKAGLPRRGCAGLGEEAPAPQVLLRKSGKTPGKKGDARARAAKGSEL